MNWKLFGTIFAAVLLALIVFCSGLAYWNMSSINSNSDDEQSAK